MSDINTILNAVLDGYDKAQDTIKKLEATIEEWKREVKKKDKEIAELKMNIENLEHENAYETTKTGKAKKKTVPAQGG